MHPSRAVLPWLVLAAAGLPASDFDVVINEIHYGPLSGDPLDEFLEIHNRGPTPVDIGLFQLTEGIGLTVPAGTRLEPKGFLVVSPDPARARERYGIANVLDAPFTGRLDNDGEIVTLRNAAGEVVCRVHYGVESIWPSRPDGLGPSLELVDPAASPDHSESWATSRIVGGTPGRANSRLGEEAPPPRVLLGSQDSWRYFKGTAEPSSPLDGWTQRTFADAGWDNAPGGFGYGGSLEFTTALPDMEDLYGTFYIRGKFTLTAGEVDAIASGRMSLSLLARYDDAFVAYVNGTEVGRDNAGAPGTLLPRTALADGSRHSQTRLSLDWLASGTLVAGQNAVAVQGLNNVVNSTDFLLAGEVELSEIPEGGADAPDVELNEVKPTDASGQGFIEIYNPGQDAIAIGGHAILDSAGRRVLVPAPTEVPAGGRAVLTAAALGFSPALGVTYALARPDASTGGDVFIDGLSTRAGPTGSSFGRFPDGDDDDYVLLAATQAAPNQLQALPEAVIHEIQFHPPFVPPSGNCTMDCSDARQWIEIHNAGPGPLNVTGWTLSKAVAFTFPAASIPMGGHLVVASSRTTFLAEHPGFDPSRVVGDWQRDLAHDSDTIHLNDAIGNRVDRVRYGDGRPLNDEEPLDGVNDRTFVGSPWPQGAEGSGRTVELIHPRLDNRFGGSWALGPAGGTPGAANAAFAAAPFAVVDEVEHFPPVPRPADPVLVTCRVSSVQAIQSVEVLWHREGTTGSGTALLADDGLSGDGAAGDLKFGGTIPAQADGTIIGFQVRARLSDGKVTTIPRPPPVPPYTGFTGPYFLYQVLSAAAPAVTGSVNYYLVLAAADRNELEDRPEASNVLLPSTFIEVEADGEWKVRYLAGVRYRGEATRLGDPKPYRVTFASEHPFRDLKRLNLMASSVENELIVADVFRRAGMPYPEEWSVNLTFQGTANPAYSRKERFDVDFLERFFGGASDSGNLYRALDPASFPDQGDLTYFGEDPDDYAPYYEKHSNEEEADYTDVIELCRAFDPVQTPDNVFADRIASLIDPGEWARFFALQSLISNRDGSIQTVTGEDYYLYRVPATSGRPDAGKWLLLPWDIEESFSDPAERLFRPQLPAVRRFLLHPRFAPLYYEGLSTFKSGVFSRLEMRKSSTLIALTFGPEAVSGLDDYTRQRIAFIGGEVPAELTAGTASALGQAVIRIGDSWRYWRGTQAPAGTSLAWTRRGYAETGWLAGETGIGYGDGDDATMLLDMEGSYTTIYARKSFTVASPAAVQSMTLTIDYDDGFVAYLNGSEVGRRNVLGQPGVALPPTATANQAIEPGNVETIDLTGFRGDLLAGENVLAFHVMNQDIDSSDLSFLPELSMGGLDGSSVGCGAVLYASGPTINLGGHANAYLTRSVKVDGSLASYDPVDAAWSASATLVPGENSILIEALDGEDGLGGVTATLTLTVHRIDRALQEAAGTLSGVTHWTAAEGPYVVRSTVTIPPGSRLEIDPGVAIFAQSGTSILIRGEIQALGTPESPILFRSASCASPWGGISIEGTGTAAASPTHTLRACDFEGTDPPGAAGAIEVSGSKVLADGSAFRRFAAAAIDASASRLEARECTFEETGGGVNAAGSTLVINGSTFRRIQGGADAVRASGNLSERSLVEDCRIEDVEDDGIEMTQSSADVRSNMVRGTADAAVLLAGDGALGRSTVTGNVIDASGAGIALVDGAHVDNGNHNTITGNQIGFHLFARSGANDGGHGTFHSVIGWCNADEALIDARSSAAFAFSDLAGGVWPGTGNISSDPRFADWLVGDYHLRSSSPCIGTGEAGSDMGALPSSGGPPVFVRADFDGSGGVNITDAINCLGYIFRSGAAPACFDAADANDDGSVDVSDSILTLFFLFRGDVTPRAPFPAPGPDPTGDSLGC